MLQKDYWLMSEAELTKRAEKYHIPPFSFHEDVPGADPFFDRDRVINALLVRDNALRTKWTVILSILALIVAIASVVVNCLKTSK